ncbi:unnamed protein product [Litomosoides sigmodontis]|uniref:Uncharacterized protein n=1 Tax=Litomosoides sigmodontis TaxID=42156 RepID=A0A3P6SZ45_LITSI|nr:unnamed protein product [Litomosoides sigmodontis]
MNIQRGRDHALPGYVEFRKWCNLSPVENWDDLKKIMPHEIINKLKHLYGHPGNIDLFVGGVAEKRYDDALVGPTFSCIIGEQFRRIRDGDRFCVQHTGVNEPRIPLKRMVPFGFFTYFFQQDVFTFVVKNIEDTALCYLNDS